MCELQDHFDLNEKHGVPENVRDQYIQICDMYKEILDMPSFFNILWQNNIQCATGHQGRGEHKKDQKKKHEVGHRRHAELRTDFAAAA
jgi:hypothetical protein